MILSHLLSAKVTSILRGISEQQVLPTVSALYEGGIRSVEITFNTPGAARMIEKVKENFGDKMLVGAGTVMDSTTARIAILAGADFLLAPTLNQGMLETCNRYAKVAVPGVLTPTEIQTAYEMGAQIVKVFPASAFGPAYFKQIKGPLDHITIMAVGGVSQENFKEYFRCGADCVGVGGELANVELIGSGNFAAITEIAKKFTVVSS